MSVSSMDTSSTSTPTSNTTSTTLTSALQPPLHCLPHHLTQLILQFGRLQMLPTDNPLLLHQSEVLSQLLNIETEVSTFLKQLQAAPQQMQQQLQQILHAINTAQAASNNHSLPPVDLSSIHSSLHRLYDDVVSKRQAVEASMNSAQQHQQIHTRPYWEEEEEEEPGRKKGEDGDVLMSSSSSSTTQHSSSSIPSSHSHGTPSSSVNANHNHTNNPNAPVATQALPQPSIASTSSSTLSSSSIQYILPPERRKTPGSRYTKIRTLRNTLFGKVALYFDTQLQCRVAIKFSNKQLLLSGKTTQGNAVAENPLKELEYLRMLSHAPRISQVRDANGNIQTIQTYIHPGQQHVLRLLDECEDETELWTVLEFCGKGEFFDIVCAAQRFDETTARKYFIQMAQGVAYLHAHLICHLDLSLENLLMDDSDNLKICDFGVARLMTLDASHHLMPYAGIKKNKPGKLGYMSPELFAGSSFYGHLSDIWAMGIILFICLTGVPPYQLPAISDHRFKLIYEGNLQTLLEAWKMSHLMSSMVKDILSHMLCPPERRMNIQQVLNHPFCKP